MRVGKNYQSLILAGVGIMTLGVLFYVVFSQREFIGIGTAAGDAVSIRAGGVVIEAEVVSSPEERARGLSGRSSLPSGHGMLFVFPEEGNWGFWMKEMSFDIDIIWINKDKQVVAIRRRATPETYPEVFYPDVPAQYVLEVPAGYAYFGGIEEGSVLSF